MRPQEPNITCLGCGQPVLGPTVINRMPNGQSCKHCVERVLDAQPSLLTAGVLQAAEEEAGERAQAPILYFPAPNHDWDEPEPA